MPPSPHSTVGLFLVSANHYQACLTSCVLLPFVRPTDLFKSTRTLDSRGPGFPPSVNATLVSRQRLLASSSHQLGSSFPFDILDADSTFARLRLSSPLSALSLGLFYQLTTKPGFSTFPLLRRVSHSFFSCINTSLLGRGRLPSASRNRPARPASTFEDSHFFSSSL